MHKSQANRAVIAARTSITHTTDHGSVGTNPALRVITPVASLRSMDDGLRKGKRSKGRGPGAVGRDSRGYRSAWTHSPYAPRAGWR